MNLSQFKGTDILIGTLNLSEKDKQITNTFDLVQKQPADKGEILPDLSSAASNNLIQTPSLKRKTWNLRQKKARESSPKSHVVGITQRNDDSTSSKWSLQNAPSVTKPPQEINNLNQNTQKGSLSMQNDKKIRGNSPQFRLDPIAIQEANMNNFWSQHNWIKADILMTNPKKEMRNDSERRKPTPPDLLELSNMYFDRQQQFFSSARISESADGSQFRNKQASPPIHTRPSTSDYFNLEQSQSTKRHKLSPMSKRPSLEEARIKIVDRKQSNTHGLHLSVNFSSQGWRQSLDPLKAQPKSSLEDLARKNTYSVESTTKDLIEFHKRSNHFPEEITEDMMDVTSTDQS